jgi:hypothetical protein
MTVLTYVLVLLQYVRAVLDDGDTRNDWLTHVNIYQRAGLERLGHLIAPADITYWLGTLHHPGITFTHAGLALVVALPFN